MKRLFCMIISMIFFSVVASAAEGVAGSADSISDIKHILADVESQRLSMLSSYTLPMLKEYASSNYFTPRKDVNFDSVGYGILLRAKHLSADINLSLKDLILKRTIVDEKLENRKKRVAHEEVMEKIDDLYELIFAKIERKMNKNYDSLFSEPLQDRYYMILKEELKNSDAQDIVEVLSSVATIWDLYAAYFGNFDTVDITSFALEGVRWTPHDWRSIILASGFHVYNEFFEGIMKYYKEIKFKHETIVRKYVAPVISSLVRSNMPSGLLMLLPTEQQDILFLRAELYQNEKHMYSPNYALLGSDIMGYLSNSNWANSLSNKYENIRTYFYSPSRLSKATQVESPVVELTQQRSIGVDTKELKNLRNSVSSLGSQSFSEGSDEDRSSGDVTKGVVQAEGVSSDGSLDDDYVSHQRQEISPLEEAL